MDAPMSIWTIYDHPSDDPTVFVARRWEVVADGGAPTDDVLRTPDLEVIRDQLEEWGFYPLGRHESDDPVIVEVWL